MDCSVILHDAASGKFYLQNNESEEGKEHLGITTKRVMTLWSPEKVSGTHRQPERPHGQVGVRSCGAGWGSVNGRLLRGNFRGEAGSGYTKLTGLLLKMGQDVQHHIGEVLGRGT